MWIYGLLLIIVLALLALFFISLTKLCYKQFKKHTNNKALSIALSLLVAIIVFAIIFINPTNVIIVYIHLLAIIAVTKLVCHIINKKREKKISSSTSLGIGVLLTTVFMIIGFVCFYRVVQTDYKVVTTKDLVEELKIVQIADSHLGFTMSAQRFNKYLDKINELNPDIVVITGDLIDDNTPYEEMIEGTNGLGKLNTKYGVYFVYGNHDKGYYNRRDYNNNDLREALKNNNVTILEDEAIELENNVVLIGRQDAQVSSRKSMQELVKNIDISNKYVIVLDHQPTDYNNEEDSKVDLVLSGHTHGGQLIPLGVLGVIFGPNDKTYGIEKRGDTTFIVTSGISDWAMVFKTGTRSEYNFISITNGND